MCGVDAGEMAGQYVDIKCNSGGLWDDGVQITSCVSAIGLAVKRVLDRLELLDKERLEKNSIEKEADSGNTIH